MPGTTSLSNRIKKCKTPQEFHFMASIYAIEQQQKLYLEIEKALGTFFIPDTVTDIAKKLDENLRIQKEQLQRYLDRQPKPKQDNIEGTSLIVP